MQNGKKTALICGMAKSGIASAILLYKNGYKVIINDMKSEISGLQEALKDIEYVNAMGQEPETLLDGVDLLVPCRAKRQRTTAEIRNPATGRQNKR